MPKCRRRPFAAIFDTIDADSPPEYSVVFPNWSLSQMFASFQIFQLGHFTLDRLCDVDGALGRLPAALDEVLQGVQGLFEVVTQPPT